MKKGKIYFRNNTLTIFLEFAQKCFFEVTSIEKLNAIL